MVSQSTKCKNFRLFDYSFATALHYSSFQSIQKEERNKVEIDGENVVELDFTGLILQLCYSVAQKDWKSTEDIYLSDFIELRRSSLKTATIIMLNASSKNIAIKSCMRELSLSKKSAQDLLEQIESGHYEIAEFFYQSFGLNLMKKESDFLLLILKNLSNKKIYPLSIHDALFFKESDCLEVVSTVNEVSFKTFGKVLKYKLSKEVKLNQAIKAI